jgi:hypothetical protein
MKAFTQGGSGVNTSLYYANKYIKNLQDSGFQIMSLNLSYYPFSTCSIRIDDFYAGEKVFVKGIALFQKDNFQYGRLSVQEWKDKNTKNNPIQEEINYKKSIGKNGEATYSWDMEYVPKTFSPFYFHEILFRAQTVIKTVEGVKDMGIVPVEMEPKNKLTSKITDEFILIVYRKATKADISR